MVNLSQSLQRFLDQQIQKWTIFTNLILLKVCGSKSDKKHNYDLQGFKETSTFKPKDTGCTESLYNNLSDSFEANIEILSNSCGKVPEKVLAHVGG